LSFFARSLDEDDDYDYDYDHDYDDDDDLGGGGGRSIVESAKSPRSRRKVIRYAGIFGALGLLSFSLITNNIQTATVRSGEKYTRGLAT
jgi:hypothetical protein